MRHRAVLLLAVAVKIMPAATVPLRAGYTDHPPFTIESKNGRPRGLAVDVLEQAAARAHLGLEWVKINGNIQEAFDQNTIDVFPLISGTYPLGSTVYYSKPWWTKEVTLISRRKDQLSTPAETAGKRIGVRRIGATRSLASSLLPKADLTPMDDIDAMLPALCHGSIDGVFIDIGVVQSELLKNSQECSGIPLFIASMPQGGIELATAALITKKASADRLFEQILQLSMDGTLTTLASRWSLYNPHHTSRLKQMIEDRHREELLQYSLVAISSVAVLIAFQSRRIRRAYCVAEAARGDAEESRQRFAAFMNHTQAVTLIKDADGRLLFVNEAFCNLRHRRPENTLGKTVAEIYPPEIAAPILLEDREVLAGSKSREVINIIPDSAGRPRKFLSLKFPFTNRAGERFLGVISLDVTERLRTEKALRFSQFSIDRSPEAILWIDSQGKVKYANQAASRQLGYTPEEFVDLPLIQINTTSSYEQLAVEQNDSRTSRTLESVYKTKGGRIFPVEVSLNYLEVDGQEFTCCISRDITERKQAESELARQAQYDLLTDLPNRRLFERRLAQDLNRYKRTPDQLVGVACIDLDGFKLVNDTLGHIVGDQLLRQVAVRLQKYLHPGDTLARMGGDEFAIVLTQIESERAAVTRMYKMLDSLQERFEIGGYELPVTASVGISIFPRDGFEVTELLQTADSAMYDAKRQGKNRIQTFTPEMMETARERLELESHLRRALERNELSLHYQPQIAPSTGEVKRFEALLRWKHPTLGSVPPSKFIPIAEETNLIVPIGTWVLQEACRNANHWYKNGLGENAGVGVNVSAVQFARPEFVEIVMGVLQDTGLPPHLLELEITESAMMQSFDDVAAKLARLRALGVSISIDDFGTGYSSLSYLQRLPIDCLKIDRSFVRDITTNSDTVSMIRALVSLAHSLAMKVVIEGVENRQQLSVIDRIGCNLVQGFLLGVPKPVDEALGYSSLISDTDLSGDYTFELAVDK